MNKTKLTSGASVSSSSEMESLMYLCNPIDKYHREAIAIIDFLAGKYDEQKVDDARENSGVIGVIKARLKAMAQDAEIITWRLNDIRDHICSSSSSSSS